ncbi:MAG: hypothetical protein KJO59_16695 [Ignavibacteria bacterium]|nr:hypothetical protein [Ignavibacteria bacterium]
MKTLLAAMLISIMILYAQDDAIKELFLGILKMDIENAEIYEEWQIVNDTELRGTSYRIINGQNKLSENLYIKKFADQWAYIAAPKNQDIALFALVEYSPKKFSFENKEHDFPQRIIYEFHKDGRLTSAIEGNMNGEFKRKEFSFVLVEE